MNEQAARLIELQRADRELAALLKDRHDKPALLRARREALGARERKLEGLRDESKRLQTAIRERELAVRSQEEKITRLRVQLNQIRENKEYKTMLHEIEQAQSELSDSEDAVLGSYDALEGAKEAAKALEAEVAAERKAVDEFAAQLDVEARELDAGIARARARRDELAATIPGESLALYERLNRSHPGAAVMPVVGGACRGCFTGLTSNQQAQLLRPEGMIVCASCGRMLYVGDDLTVEKLNAPERYDPLA